MTLSPQQMARIDAVLDQALEAPPDERRQLVDRSLAAFPDLLPVAHKLLELASEGDDVVDSRVGVTGPLFDEATRELTAGTTIDDYRLLCEIGRGGMASVFLAEPRDEPGARVALKVSRFVGEETTWRARFERERAILAATRHPNVAGLLSHGSTEDGRPYFVLEYVDGEPIDAYCDARQLPIQIRLEIFRVLARTVDSFHRRQIIHRDLKPGNVLVTASGQIKLLDFGIAKLLDADSGMTLSGLTRTGLELMTPEYASPEQIHGERIGPASDLYQLGLILYVLLAGRTPLDLAGKNPAEVFRTVGAHRIPAPSAALLDGSQTEVAARARARGSEPEALAATLAESLDGLLLETLARRAEDRPSVSDLIQALD